ncbi:helix-turn-helix transcriptional regulator [Spirosoma sordidisoli]|uniref:WYL domain-containing protein n=1 Tax=Spirosoma sordidisoli TaxID=2502893 RepID=A0A4Q2UU67_9BACT|nr:WYL domain-containing protein [Spirosoma sordidisoli]RYC71330.1 WYL domain-containing protein [Spirosoma sordidisoli]
MPIVKNRLDRLQKINGRLNRWGGRPVSKEELMRLCGVSERTLKEDLQFMRDEYDAPIVYRRSEGGYCYQTPFDMAIQLPFSHEELAALETAVATLNQFKELAMFRDLEGLVDKLEKAVRFRFSGSADYRHYLHFESVPYSRGSEYVAFLLQAIRDETVVTFSHQKFDAPTPSTHRVFPYLIKEHRNRWYLIGYQVDYGLLRVFGLDRIVPGSLAVDQTAPHVVIPDFDADSYFRHSLGVAVYEDQEPEAVVLSFSPQQGRYFRAQPFFPFAEDDVLCDTELECRIRLRMIINKELVYELARLGPAVKVLSPPHLVAQLKTYLQESLQQYAD